MAHRVAHVRSLTITITTLYCRYVHEVHINIIPWCSTYVHEVHVNIIPWCSSENIALARCWARENLSSRLCSKRGKRQN